MSVHTTTPDSRRPLRRHWSRIPYGTLLAVVMTATVAEPADAQRRARRPESLRGSKASVEKMYEFARANGLAFYLTPTNIQHAVAAGKLVPLEGDSTYELTKSVGFSYATPEAKQFVRDFAPQYLAACGTPLTVTSAARPTSRQPRNANPHSVHPTGIAVDLRRPNAGPCQTWLRNALAELERMGIVEATEERHPVHMHVAVLTVPGRVATLPSLVTGQVAARVATPPVQPPLAAQATPAADPPDTAPRPRTYRVREGDTLWDVARKAGVTVQELARANNRSPRAVLRPGVTLRLPASR
jgi:LysM repeat protein